MMALKRLSHPMMMMILHSEHCQTSLTCLVTGVYNISFFAVSLFTKLGLGGAETVAVFTALVRCGGTLASTLLLLRSGYPPH